MANVDDRVVAMQFDNKTFEQRISATLISLDKLKKSLDFANENRNISGLQRSANAFQLDGIAAATDHISGKFTAMGAAAFSVINNLVTRAVDAGLRISKAFTFAPTIDGFHEYETNLNSIQTILANTASDNTTLDQVNAALQKLNVYSDQTIYNFGQMAKNIGTFTAAGVDLDTSVNAIKGIANLAALSGSNADQASSAMYQLSQALATGKLKLIDWNSVVNAGMGGEIFKKALFETGKAMGTLEGVPLDQTFEKWEKAGGSFRDTLESGWVNADVLTTTLAGFTGDLTEEMLLQKGYNQAQATQIMKQAQMAKAAATEVKTFTQLIGTVKEAVGTGWADSFSIIVGNFTEAKALWTGVNNAIGGFVSQMSDARNNLLQGWKDLGGREVLINNLKNAFGALGDIIGAIHVAFREIFPATTSKQLFDMTVRFGMFIDSIKPGTETIIKIGKIFSGVFAALEIGWEIVKNVARVFAELFGQLTDGTGSASLDFFAKMGDNLVSLNEALVEGGGIKKFFDDLLGLIAIFKGGFSDGIDVVSDATGRLSERFGWLVGVAKTLGEVIGWLKDHFDQFRDGIEKAASVIGDVFGNIGHAIAETMKTGNFDEVFDIINTGLISGILLILRKFMKNGFKDFGGGFLKKINDALKGLTSVLQGMQAKLKAEALQKIAVSIGILAASMAVLSLIDSAALTKAIAAMATGFGMLIGAMALLTKVTDGVKGAANIGILATSMVALSTAMLILSAAVKVLSTMSWSELAKGLGGVVVLLGLIVATVALMPDAKSLISTGIGMSAIAVAVRILANAVEAMAGMSWAEMAQGLTGVAVALGLIVVATRLMSPQGMLAAGAGMAALAVGLNIIVGAIALMGHIKIDTLVQGLAGLGGALLIIAGAMRLMPLSLPVTGAGLVLVGVGLTAVAGAVALMGKLDLGEMAKGISAVAVVLGVLAIAMNAMSGSIVGAIAIGIASGAMVLLAGALKVIGKMSVATIAKSIIGLATALGVLGGASLLISASIPSILGLGAALVLIGGGFALFGIGAAGVANALKLIADTGSVAIDALLQIIKVLLDKLPDFAEKLALALIIAATKLLEALPGMISHVGDILVALFKALEEATPQFLETMTKILVAVLDHITENFPLFIEKGAALLMALLQGILGNIAQVTSTVLQIIVAFVNAVAANIPQIVASAINLLVQFLLGIANNIGLVIDAGFQIIVSIIEGIGKGQLDIIKAGAKLISDLIAGIIGAAQDIIDAGTDAAVKFLHGMVADTKKLANGVGEFIVGILDALTDAVKKYSGKIRDGGIELAGALMDGMTFGIAGKIGGVVSGVKDVATSVISAPLKILGIGGPSRVFMGYGEGIMEGMAIGIANNTSAVKAGEVATNDVLYRMNKVINSVALAMAVVENINPTITPVVDLTNVSRSAAEINRMIDANAIVASASFDQAAQISLVSNRQNGSESEASTAPEVREIKFEQTINAPTQLSTSDIYRNTKTQLAMAKEDLKVS